jgi:hypothetical protein
MGALVVQWARTYFVEAGGGRKNVVLLDSWTAFSVI